MDTVSTGVITDREEDSKPLMPVLRASILSGTQSSEVADVDGEAAVSAGEFKKKKSSARNLCPGVPCMTILVGEEGLVTS